MANLAQPSDNRQARLPSDCLSTLRGLLHKPPLAVPYAGLFAALQRAGLLASCIDNATRPVPVVVCIDRADL